MGVLYLLPTARVGNVFRNVCLFTGGGRQRPPTYSQRPPDKDAPGQRTSLDRDPLDRVPPGQRPPDKDPPGTDI